jgi:hypothetical protein
MIYGILVVEAKVVSAATPAFRRQPTAALVVEVARAVARVT